MRYLVIHHSGVDVDSSAESIADYHVKTLGWPGIGYHFLVHWGGEIDYVGDIETSRANVYGRNPEVIGICLPGNFNDRWPSEAQLRSVQSLVRYLRTILPLSETVGHRDIALPASPTACPGETWPEWKGRVT